MLEMINIDEQTVRAGQIGGINVTRGKLAVRNPATGHIAVSNDYFLPLDSFVKLYENGKAEIFLKGRLIAALEADRDDEVEPAKQPSVQEEMKRGTQAAPQIEPLKLMDSVRGGVKSALREFAGDVRPGEVLELLPDDKKDFTTKPELLRRATELTVGKVHCSTVAVRRLLEELGVKNVNPAKLAKELTEARLSRLSNKGRKIILLDIFEGREIFITDRDIIDVARVHYGIQLYTLKYLSVADLAKVGPSILWVGLNGKSPDHHVTWLGRLADGRNTIFEVTGDEIVVPDESIKIGAQDVRGLLPHWSHIAIAANRDAGNEVTYNTDQTEFTTAGKEPLPVFTQAQGMPPAPMNANASDIDRWRTDVMPHLPMPVPVLQSPMLLAPASVADDVMPLPAAEPASGQMLEEVYREQARAL